MSQSAPLVQRLQNKLKRESHRAIKQLYHRVSTQQQNVQSILFVVGCQRSGTTLMMKILEKDFNTSIYHEHSQLSSEDQAERLRLNPLPDVQHMLERDRAPFIVLKPLVESQHTTKLLQHFSGSKALWMYRHYSDVASSNLKRFGMGNGIRNLRFIMRNTPNNWRSEGASAHVREIVSQHFSEEMNPHDAAALFWYARNALYFEQQLETNASTMLVRYSDLAMKPSQTMHEIYRFVNQTFPGPDLVSDVKRSSLGKGKGVQLSPAVEKLCESMLHRLDQVYDQTEYCERLNAELQV